MKFIIVVVAFLISCNHRYSNVKETNTNVAHLSKMEQEDIRGRSRFVSVTIDSGFEGEPVYRRGYYDSTKTLRFITEVISYDTVQYYHAHFRNDKLFLLEHHIADSSGVLSEVKYFFENNKSDTLGNKKLLLHPSHYIEVSNGLYKIYRKLK
jgi:hypothetical protein